jgi:hypothetical protein
MHGILAMRTFLRLSVPFLCVSLFNGCAVIAPRVAVEPTTFGHPEELIKGAGSADKYWMLADRRIFAVMAFLNTVGYDDEAPNAQMLPLRLKVREKVTSRLASHPEKLRAWQRYYASRKRGSWQYANFALSLSTDFPFRRIRPNQELIYKDTAWDLIDFPKVLNDYWATLELETVWEEMRPYYAAEIARYRPDRMAEEMEHLWRYLRMPRRDGWIVIHIPNPLQRHFTASANQFERYFYSIDGPGSSNGGLNVHEYLHTFINGLVRDCYHAHEHKLLRYFAAGMHAPISATVQNPKDWVSECLVFALDNRLWAQRASSMQNDQEMLARVKSLTREGFTLLEPLYVALADFEKTSLSFDRYLPILLSRLPEYHENTGRQ